MREVDLKEKLRKKYMKVNWKSLGSNSWSQIRVVPYSRIKIRASANIYYVCWKFSVDLWNINKKGNGK